MLALIVTGMTNRQIAQRLTISEKTAEGHVGNVLADFDCSSRIKAAGTGASHRLVGRRRRRNYDPVIPSRIAARNLNLASPSDSGWRGSFMRASHGGSKRAAAATASVRLPGILW